MSRLPLRVSLLILCLAAIAGASFFFWTSTRSVDRDAAALRQFDHHARSIEVAVADLRAAQQSYVAAGQGADFWFAKVTALHKEIDERLAVLRASTESPDTATELDAAASALLDFSQMDIRARDFVRGGQSTLASDMVFADGFELTKKAGDAVERARLAEQSARETRHLAARRQHELALAGAGGLSILGLLLLVPRGRRPDPEPVGLSGAAAMRPIAESNLSYLNDFDVVVKPATPAMTPLNLDEVAALCADLARIADTRPLPSMLERTAGILDASGIVLWIADPDGRELSPILVHGYPPHLATRMGTILRDAENVTASAYRTSLLQTMKGDAISSGAIAVPLVATGGCVGVMAAEMKNGGEQQESLLAAATIIAAQLATLVGPPSVRSKAEAAS